MDKLDLEATLRKLEALHLQMGQEIAALRLMKEQNGLSAFSGTIEIPPPYGKETQKTAGDPIPYSLSAPTLQPDLLNAEKTSDKPANEHPAEPKPAKGKPSAPTLCLEEAKKVIMDGYILDHPGDADRLLKTLVFRLIDGSAKGFKASDLPAARIVARSMIEHAGLRATGPGFTDAHLRRLMQKCVPFEPITSIRRLPR